MSTMDGELIDRDVQALVRLALEEDIASGDITTEALLERPIFGRAEIIAKEQLVACGGILAKYIFQVVDSAVVARQLVSDGTRLKVGERFGVFDGPIASLLCAERVVLNFLQRLSGIASTTDKLVQLTEGTGVKIYDTRKTTPGWRRLEKHAVKVGGGCNHRRGLYDAVLIKNNHLDAFGLTPAAAVRLARKSVAAAISVEVEVRNLAELSSALEAGPDIVLLDNMAPGQIKSALEIVKSLQDAPEVEVSGGINEENILNYALAGVQRISLGALTHCVKSVDLSMRIEAISS